MKIFNFLEKQLFLNLHSHLLIIFHWIIRRLKTFWSSGLWWPSLAFGGLGWIFLKQRPAFGDEINWAFSNNQISKPISKSKSPIYSTVQLARQIFEKWDCFGKDWGSILSNWHPLPNAPVNEYDVANYQCETGYRFENMTNSAVGNIVVYSEENIVFELQCLGYETLINIMYLVTVVWIFVQKIRGVSGGLAGWAIAHPDFGRLKGIARQRRDPPRCRKLLMPL